jgi:D-psicose/D-tagatose/L-ribulose 3-epimerase
MGKVGIYYAYWTHDWDADFNPFISKVKKLGFEILEVNAGTVANFTNTEKDRLKNAAEAEGIELTYCIGMTAKYDIASPDPNIRRNGIEFLQKMAEAIRYMGNKQLGGIIYSSWPGKLPEGAVREEYVDRSVSSMKEAVKAAEDCDVFFNLEVVNRFEQYMFNTCVQAVEYVECVGSDHCKVMLDSFHMNIEEDSFRDAVLNAGKHLGHFHIGETNRRAPGRGRIPWTEIFQALNEINYQGGIVMEPFLMPGGEVGRDISVFRDLRDGLDLDEEARRACAFVHSMMSE